VFTSNDLTFSKQTLLEIVQHAIFQNQESILPNFDFFVFPIFAFKLGHFKALTIFSHATNTQA
jgi:hypothetical protein